MHKSLYTQRVKQPKCLILFAHSFIYSANFSSAYHLPSTVGKKEQNRAPSLMELKFQ